MSAIKYLVEQGMDVSVKAGFNGTPFFNVVKSSNLEAIQFFLDRGANVNELNRRGEIPLHYGLASINVETLCFLVEQGADVNAKNPNGVTPLHLLCSRFHDEVSTVEKIEWMVKFGADINAEDDRGRTPLSEMIAGGCSVATVKKMVAWGADIRFKNRDIGNLLFVVPVKTWLEMRPFLLEQGLDLKARSHTGNTLLHSCLLRGFPIEVIRELIVEDGFDVNLHGPEGNTPLQMAVTNLNVSFKDSKAIVEWLIDHGADINLRSRGNGQTLVHHVMNRWRGARTSFGEKDNWMGLLKYLVAHGADVTIKDDKGKSALFLAIRVDDPKAEMATFLVEHGCDWNETSKEGDSLLNVIIEEGNPKTLEIVMDRVEDFNSPPNEGAPLFRAIAFGRFSNEFLFKMIEKGADPTVKSSSGYNLLALAPAMDLKMLEYLVELGLDVNQSDEHNVNIPLHCVARSGAVEHVKILLEHGANPMTKDHLGKTPLDIAREYSKYASSSEWNQKRFQETIKILEEAMEKFENR